MVQRLESVGGGERDHPSADDSRTVLREMCGNLGQLLREAQRPAQRVMMSIGAVTLEVEWPSQPAPVAAPPVTGPPPAAGAPQTPAPAPAPPRGHIVAAPLVGTFYSAPEPGAQPYVKVGDLVESGQQIGIVEAMKLMNPIEADRAGRVGEILVGDAEAVEYDQPLLVLVAAGEE